MSRTKGALNKKKKVKVVLEVKHRKRGRPKKVVAIVEKKVFPVVKAVKFLGYCRCEFMITTKELLSKFIFECPGCGKRNRTSKLKKALKVEDKPKTKKEYLESTIHAPYVSMSTHDENIDPKSLKIQE